MKNFLIHFDTSDNTDPSNNPYNHCNLKLANPVHNPRSIKLKSVEMPLLIPTTITSSMTPLRFYITDATETTREDFVSNPFPVGDYDILQLLSRLGECYQTGNSHAVFSLNSDNKVSVEVVFASIFAFKFYFIQCPLLKMLGYSGNETFTRQTGYTDNNGNYYPDWSVMTMNFQNDYNLHLYNPNPHNYLSLYISNLLTKSPNANGIMSSFKIPLNTKNSNVYFYQEKNNFVQKIDIEDNIVLENLEVSIIDKSGNVFSGSHLNYSFTLEFVTE